MVDLLQSIAILVLAVSLGILGVAVLLQARTLRLLVRRVFGLRDRETRRRGGPGAER